MKGGELIAEYLVQEKVPYILEFAAMAMWAYWMHSMVSEIN